MITECVYKVLQNTSKMDNLNNNNMLFLKTYLQQQQEHAFLCFIFAFIPISLLYISSSYQLLNHPVANTNHTILVSECGYDAAAECTLEKTQWIQTVDCF